ncbi:MAG: hypothetical protein CSA50_04450 [Gammaproteobacteria bacterium]|nr:MAG: hypothetical protein CSA50_04450 [Gammaproteobacteria bacterium]
MKNLSNSVRVSLVTVALLVVGIGLFAKAQACDQDYGQPGKHYRGDHMMMHQGFIGNGLGHKAIMKRSFDQEEIRTLVEARLLLKGNENLKIGDIRKTDGGFDVDITTHDDSLVRTLELAPNAMPLHRYERIQKHMADGHSGAYQNK